MNSYRSPYRCPLCTFRTAKPNARNGICRHCRTDEAMFPVNHAGRRRKRREIEETAVSGYV